MSVIIIFAFERGMLAMRRFLATVLIAAVLIVQLTAGVAYAGSSDVRTAVEQLNRLDNNSKGMLLGMLWDFAVAEIGKGSEVTVDDIYEAIKSALTNIQNPSDNQKNMWETIIAETGNTSNDGKIAGESLKLIIGKILNNKQIIIDYYNTFKQFVDKGFVKEFLGLPANATDGQVYEKLLPYLEEVVTLNDEGKFVRYGDVKAKIAAKIGVRQELLDLFLGIDVNGEMDKYIARMNNYIGNGPNQISTEDAIYMLELYNLFAPRTTPTPGGGGGGIVVPPEDTEDDMDDINKIADELDEISSGDEDPEDKISSAAKLIKSAVEKIDAVEDVEKALEIAENIILKTKDIFKEAESKGILADELSRELKAIADKVISKVGKTTVKVVASDGLVKAVLSSEEADKQVQLMEDIVKTAAALNKALAESKADVKVDAVLRIELDCDDAYDASAVELPGSIFKAAVEKKLDKIAIDTGIAVISIAPHDMFAEGEVRLEAAKVDKDTLPEDIKALVGNNAVYDFNLTVDGKALDKFAEPVEISIPYTLKAGENPEKLTVFYINDKNELENVIGVYDEDTKTVKFTVRHFSKYVIKVNAVTFSDLNTVKWAKDGIEAMAAKGIIKGVGGGKFDPSSNVTRAQFAAMIARALNLVDDAAESSFTDVDESYLFYKEISAAYNAGIVKGTPDGSFLPNAYITRQDAAVMIANALVYIKGKSFPEDADAYIGKYVDQARISKYARDAAALCSKYSIIIGSDKGEYDPKGHTTRAAAALMIYRLFNVK
ncbi:hypothetical protein CDQ84_10720 [Clostridium thermosuccinogenes]|uniref:SLH domain-containing protein n=2 Tax=Clostridium thermosuccinogenes TaxID=84032 RepID=A0A2K2FDC9_9CLOT|nr:hypothetical protein CDO33_01330 [Pseudoclostridium thermosuccinogenes]PNT96766.1 hypothetical protein CDQ85_10565 [Pseudoclostridium thermosuccinogenes]PNT98603.1 hypothetical protein CDQ84_10720 [Pseudoclostridium thermosuccinogenes]